MASMHMVRNKLFQGCSSRTTSEISLIYQSASKSTLGPGLSSSSRGQYERVGGLNVAGKRALPAEQKNVLPKARKNLKLGGNAAGRTFRIRVVRLQCLLKAPSTLICRMKEQYAVWKESARFSNIRISDLFVCNQLFMHMHATPVNGRRKQQLLKPSVGFVTRAPGPSGARREMEAKRELREK